VKSALCWGDWRGLRRRGRSEAISRKRHGAAPVALAVAFGLIAAACGGGVPSAGPPTSKGPGHPTTTTFPPAVATTTTTTVPEEPGWTTLGSTSAGVAVDERFITGSDGRRIVVVRFRASLTQFNLHVGSSDPPLGGAAVPANAGSAVSSAEVPALLAAFNGGFLASAHVGGFEVDGVTVVPLVSGAASFVVDANGSGHVGAWGQDLPAPGEQVVSVRQNLSPLVINAQPSPVIDNIGAWGATLGGGAAVARSALGEDAHGNILYAGAMSAVPADLADALIACGAVSAMQMDINPAWVQLAFASGPGGGLNAGVPGQNRPANQYEVGWTRDFVAVLQRTPVVLPRLCPRCAVLPSANS